MEFTLEETIHASPEVVFAAVSDIEAFTEWMPNLVSVKKLTEGETRIGTQFEETRKMFGKEAKEHFEVTKFEPPTTYELFVDGIKGSSGKAQYRFTYTFSPTDNGGTHLHMLGQISGMGAAGSFMAKLMIKSFKNAINKDHAAIKEWIESKRGS